MNIIHPWRTDFAAAGHYGLTLLTNTANIKAGIDDGLPVSNPGGRPYRHEDS